MDKKTIPGRSYLSDAQWSDTGMCSDFEIEKVICAANFETHAQQQKVQVEESWLMLSEGISRPIPRTERRDQVKIASKIHAFNRQKKKRW